MSNIEVYVDKEKFQFITDFEKKPSHNSKGEDIILDFGELNVDERVFLSAFLTYIVQNDGIDKENKENNLYDIIFNFNGNKKKATSFHDSFITVVSEFLGTKSHFISYIVDHYNDIINNQTVIRRTQLNRSEMDALYSLKFQRSYKSLINVLYIIGVSKSNVPTAKLNKLNLDRFYKTSPSLTKKRIKEIMSKLCISYKIHGDYVYFGKGFNIKLAEKYASEKKKQFDKIQFDEEKIVNELPVIQKPSENTEKNVVETPVNKPKYSYLEKQMLNQYEIQNAKAKQNIFEPSEDELNNFIEGL